MDYYGFYFSQGFQSGPVPGTFTRLRSCIVPTEITESPKISSGQNHKVLDFYVFIYSPPGGFAGGRIGTRFLHPRGRGK